ncbi:aldehyde dehydrogenase [Melanomma pulvis-pyrius CBS 109.77]|uniref:aldehyde dehydrogenase (NAD(+)) n=1 Tax=Melanomma pulvis-pyrius CBS 109.77 TaxID=1314802 RepID=A0A6A6X030_9PLEO|nr:aldehyde dehydrogenase [Melanomma pulvis-pyrius CBS 109.77]
MVVQANGTSSSGKFILKFDEFFNIINGGLIGTDETRRGINPSTLEENADVPVSTKKDVDDAVRFAREAAEVWAETPITQRQQAVTKFADALRSLKDDFAKMLVKEQGKPLIFAKAEVDNAVRWLEEQAKLPFPEDMIEDTDEKQVVTRYMPLGVALGIVPWNFPIMLACGKIAPALISGNALIIKPSPFTPYCGLKLVELAQEFFPPGVIQALSGDDNLGPWLTAHPLIDKVSFTGSTMTGKRVMESCSKTLKRVTLELGGNDPAIVCSEVNIKETAPKIAQLALLNSGQICIAIKRVYVHSSIYEEFLAEVVKAAKSLLVGDGFEENIFMGPIQNAMQYERVTGFIEDSKKQKWKVAMGGEIAISSNGHRTGYFINPTVIDNPPDDSRIVMEEPFGPIFPLLRWDNENDVINRANDTLMGLGASVWSNDLVQASRIAKRLKAGSVWVNTHTEIQPDAAFGGYKQSGLGAEWGVQGLKSYCNTQTLYLKKK